MTDESLFREVDEEVRQDQFKEVWKRYGRFFTVGAALVVAGVGGAQYWQYYQRTQSETAAVVYLEALKKAQDGKYEDAAAAFAAVKAPGFGQLARLRAAATLGEKGDVEGAVAAYDALAGDAATAPALADLARIRAGYLLIDTQTPDQLLARLGRFDKDGEVWRHQAREIFGLAAYRTGDMKMADRYMNAIFSDPETPDAMRQRAQVMIQLITPQLPKS